MSPLAELAAFVPLALFLMFAGTCLLLGAIYRLSRWHENKQVKDTETKQLELARLMAEKLKGE